MEQKYAYYSNNEKRLVDQVSEGCQPECSGWHLQALKPATRSTSASTYNISRKKSPNKTYKHKNPHATETPSNRDEGLKPWSPERSRQSSQEYIYKLQSPENVIGHKGGMHKLTPKEEIFKPKTLSDTQKTRSPQNIIECESYKYVPRARNQKNNNKSNGKDHCCQTNSIYSTQIPKAVSPKREVATNAPDYGRHRHLPRTSNNSTETYSKVFPKSVSPENIPKTGSPYYRQKNDSPRHSPKHRNRDNLRTRSPQKLYRPKSRENVYAQSSRHQFGKSYEKIWPTNSNDEGIGRQTMLRTENPDHSRYPINMQIPGCPETYHNQEGKDNLKSEISKNNLHGCVEKICRPGNREHTPRRQYSPNTDIPGSCGLYGPCSPNGRHIPDHQENIAGDYKGQGGDGAQTFMQVVNNECSCPAANEKLKEEKSKKHAQGDSLWAHWKRMTQKKKPSELDNLQRVLRRLGEMRAYHWMLVCAAAPVTFMWAYVLYGQMFVMATPDHFCATKQLKGALAVADNVEFRRKWSIPMVNGEYDKCNKIGHDYTKITNKSDQTEIEKLLKAAKAPANIPCDAGWEFIYNDVSYSTLTSDGQLVCKNAYKKAFSHSLFFVGALFGSVGFGVLGDEFGRLPALVASSMVVVLGTLVSTATSNVWYFALARLLAGIGYDTCFTALYILVLEYVGPHYRALALNLIVAVFFGLGGLLLPSIASLIGNWKNFLYATSLPMLMVAVFPFFLPESLRWLLLRGKLTRALRIIAKMQKAAKREVSQRDLDNLIYEVVNHPASGNIRDAMSSPYISAMVSIFAAHYLVVMMLFETLVLLTEHTGVAFFIAFRISASMEVPAGLVVALLVSKGGRRLCTRVPMLIAGILTCSAAAVSKGTGLTAITTVARFAAAMSRNTLYLWTAEALPTGARAAGCGIAHAGGHLGCMLAPFLAHQVGKNNSSWPLILIGVLTILAAMFVCILPETMRKSLPQKISVSKKRFKQSYQSFRKRLTPQGMLESARLREKRDDNEKQHTHSEKEQHTQLELLPQLPSTQAAHGDSPACPLDPLRHVMPRQWRTSDGII